MIGQVRFSHMPAISVVMATYNRQKVIAEAIESVIGQSFRDWELLIVDDGSDDATGGIIEPYLQTWPGIRYLRHRNRKASYARNAGIQASFGRYITFIDSDDLYREDHLASRMALMEADPELQLLSGGFSAPLGMKVRDRLDPERFVAVQDCVITGTLFGYRELFMNLGGFRNIEYGEDSDLWERACRRVATRRISRPESYLYRPGPDSITANHIPLP